jgi:hypothetical protein
LIARLRTPITVTGTSFSRIVRLAIDRSPLNWRIQAVVEDDDGRAAPFLLR